MPSLFPGMNPLALEDVEPLVDLQQLLHEIYDQGSYDLRLDHIRALMPALAEADMLWVHEVLRQQELR